MAEENIVPDEQDTAPSIDEVVSSLPKRRAVRVIDFEIRRCELPHLADRMGERGPRDEFRGRTASTISNEGASLIQTSAEIDLYSLNAIENLR